jgi:hypothetical protein
MSEFNVKIRAQELGKDLENMSDEMEEQLNQAVADLANATYANIVAKAQQDLNTTRKDYLKGLSFEQIGENSYMISLEGSFSNSLEQGSGPYDIKQKSLESQKIISVGPRTGQPWVQEGKNGRYAHVPFEHQPYSKAPNTGDLGSAIRLMKAMNKQGTEQYLTSVFKDEFGKPMSGKVATARSVIPNLDKITKFQKVYENKETGSFSVKALYMTWRTISDNGPSWTHPGFKGIDAFGEAEKFVEEQIDNILNTLIG